MREYLVGKVSYEFWGEHKEKAENETRQGLNVKERKGLHIRRGGAFVRVPRNENEYLVGKVSYLLWGDNSKEGAANAVSQGLNVNEGLVCKERWCVCVYLEIRKIVVGKGSFSFWGENRKWEAGNAISKGLNVKRRLVCK